MDSQPIHHLADSMGEYSTQRIGLPVDDERTQAAIRRLKQGDIGGLEMLVEVYQVQAVRAAYLITNDHASAEDVVQTAFVRVYHRIDQFDSKRDLAPWFMKVVANAANKAVRGSGRNLSLDAPTPIGDGLVSFADFLADEAPNPEAEAVTSELRTAV